MSVQEILQFENQQALAHAAGQRFLAASREAVRDHGRFVVVLCGGSTPRVLHRVLASGPLRPQVPWSRTVILFGDERIVPPEHEYSNFHMAWETLLDHVRIPEGQVHRIQGELDPAEAAKNYESVLRRVFKGQDSPRFDLLLLGMGEDGHTASLFPGTDALNETERWVVANHVPQLDSWRVTLTFPALCAAQRILFLITGEKKAQVLAEAFAGLPHDTPYPCEHVVPANGVREILVDRAAAAHLHRTHAK